VTPPADARRPEPRCDVLWRRNKLGLRGDSAARGRFARALAARG
jgi:hypothetical protein